MIYNNSKVSLSIFFISLFSILSLSAQTVISGKVSEKNGTPIEGANVYLDGTYDGTATDAQGNFSFETEEKGPQLIKVTFLSFEPYTFFGDVKILNNLKIKLREDVNSLETVVLSAGTLEASDNSKVSVLKPLDVVTTASALGDFVGALQTLPGTTTVAEDGRLFVRGGDASETQIFIDGIRVFTPYTPTTNNAPTRGRYSPFLFDGITFSTGGYSAEFGQALSSVLLLNSIDEPAQEATNIQIMSVGGGFGHTEKWDKSSLSINTSYINLAPYLALFNSRNDFQKPFQTFSGEAVYRQKLKNGLLKVYGAFDTSNFSLTQEDINNPDGTQFSLNNKNFYGNTSYSGVLTNDLKIDVGASYTLATTEIGINNITVDDTENSAHFKIKLKNRFSNRFKLTGGVEQFITDFEEQVSGDFNPQEYGYKNNLTAAFAETDIIFSRNFAIKTGLRVEYSAMFNDITIAPRLSLAYKTGKNSQLSIAYGNFNQQPNAEILKFEQNLRARNTSHYIANYQYTANNRIFRAELYRKDYTNLVTYDTTTASSESNFTNNGDGYAQGLDVFFRDDESIKNLDYWVSYSYLDSERKFQNYPIEATPSFASKHNASVVTKYWVEKWQSQIGASYTYGSGRSYTNPNEPGFLQEQTRAFNSLSLNCAYLITPQKIVYASVNNVLGFNNINGYQYANTPNASGQFNRQALLPATDQFFFVGFFWTISDDGKENQLDNL
ncbi:TonB-dependent receptor [Patiriisocius marinus]|uniref:TonB-dependent receptor n=1 Tax=Patiriisocius marinus TaxID=1397112 RepID=A0A5J4IZN6_9FLAO|nr:TonB-dependent receptor [Patiriisocius marinus]GER59088.1 TonB-dependent receptor [Patiriisocius marinus]